MAETIQVDDSRLSEEQKERFELAFMEPDATVEWQGGRYYVRLMDQDYPDEGEGTDDPIKVTFHLEKVAE